MLWEREFGVCSPVLLFWLVRASAPPPPAPTAARSRDRARAAPRAPASAALRAGDERRPRRPPRRRRRCACARAPPAACARAARWPRPGGPRGRRAPLRGSCLAAPAQSAQLEQVARDAVARVAAHAVERALQRVGVEFAGDSTRRADDGVVAAGLALLAGPHGGGPERAVEQAQLQERGDVPVDGDAVDAHARPPHPA